MALMFGIRNSTACARGVIDRVTSINGPLLHPARSVKCYSFRIGEPGGGRWKVDAGKREKRRQEMQRRLEIRQREGADQQHEGA